MKSKHETTPHNFFDNICSTQNVKLRDLETFTRDVGLSLAKLITVSLNETLSAIEIECMISSKTCSIHPCDKCGY